MTPNTNFAGSTLQSDCARGKKTDCVTMSNELLNNASRDAARGHAHICPADGFVSPASFPSRFCCYSSHCHICIHTHIYICIHTHIYICISPRDCVASCSTRTLPHLPCHFCFPRPYPPTLILLSPPLYISPYICMYVDIHICTSMYVYIYAYKYIYSCAYACIYLYIYIYVNIYIYTYLYV